MLNLLFLFFALQNAAGSIAEPQFTLGNLITIVVVIGTATAVVMRTEQKGKATSEEVKALAEMMRQHADQDRGDMREIRELFRRHTEDSDEHIGRRLFDELTRRLNQQDAARDRIEAKLDNLLRLAK